MANVIVALGNVSWEQQLISSFGHPMFGVSIVKRCVDGIDIQATARSMDIDAVIVADEILRVDRDCVSEVLAAGIRFIAITQTPTLWNEQGVIDTVALIHDDVPSMAQQVMKCLRESTDEPMDVVADAGTFIAVTGFGGASGRSVCALELAGELVHSGTTCLVDADIYAPSLAQEVGYTELTGGLLGLTRMAELRRLSNISLHETAVTLENDIVFLRGIPAAHRWVDLRLHALTAMWNYVVGMVDHVVVDCGPAYDLLDRHVQVTAQPTRAIAALTAIDIADTVIVTANATDVGITRLVNGYANLYPFIEDKDVIVVVHGVPNGRAENDIKLVMARELGVTAAICLQHNWRDYARVAEFITQKVPTQTTSSRRSFFRKRTA